MLYLVCVLNCNDENSNKKGIVVVFHSHCMNRANSIRMKSRLYAKGGVCVQTLCSSTL